METKLFEIRDEGTCIPALGVMLKSREMSAPVETRCAEAYLIYRAGFREGDNEVLLIELLTMEAQFDPFAWRSPRTMPTAHQWIIEHWHELTSGQVVDVRTVLGETAEPAISDRFGAQKWHGGRLEVGE